LKDLKTLKIPKKEDFCEWRKRLAIKAGCDEEILLLEIFQSFKTDLSLSILA